MRQLIHLRGCEMHSSVILSQVDIDTLRKVGINLTCEPRYQTKKALPQINIHTEYNIEKYTICYFA